MNRSFMLACIVSFFLLTNIIFPDYSMCHEPGIVVINELLINPSAVSDSRGEWIELYNASSSPVDLFGWKITDNRNDIFIINSSLVINPGNYLVLARCDDTSLNGGVESDYLYKGLYLANSYDTVSIYDVEGICIDSVTYSTDMGFPIIAGASMERIHPSCDAALAASWMPSILVFGNGDRGTPGYKNSCFSAPKMKECNRPPYYAIMKVFSYRANNLLVTLDAMAENEISGAGIIPDIKKRIENGDIIRALAVLERMFHLSMI